MIDLHCHILPGLDDGAETVEKAVDMARMARDDGITAIVATPHLGRGGNRLDALDQVAGRLEELRRALREASVGVDLFAGAEVYISHDLTKDMRTRRKSLVLNGGSYLLVEFPSDHVYPGVKNLFFDLMSEGIVPIIAHPERNSAFAHNPGLLFELIVTGALAQANAGSFVGRYGRQAAGVARRFLECHLIHFIASDSHGPNSISPRLSEAVAVAESLVGSVRAAALVNDNPQAVIENREIPAVFSPVNPQEKKRSLSIKLPKFAKRRR